MASTAEKQPVLGSAYRMIIERMIAKFLDDPSESLEFPATLTIEQRDFVRNYIFKCQGLKSKCTGKGKLPLSCR